MLSMVKESVGVVDDSWTPGKEQPRQDLPAFNSRWYVAPLGVALLPVAVGLLFGVGYLVPALEPVFSVLVAAVFGTAIVGGFLSFFAYFYEAKRLRDHDSSWVPRWRYYVLLQLIFTPLLVAPVYIYQRHRHVGLW